MAAAAPACLWAQPSTPSEIPMLQPPTVSPRLSRDPWGWSWPAPLKAGRSGSGRETHRFHRAAATAPGTASWWARGSSGPGPPGSGSPGRTGPWNEGRRKQRMSWKDPGPPGTAGGQRAPGCGGEESGRVPRGREGRGRGSPSVPVCSGRGEELLGVTWGGELGSWGGAGKWNPQVGWVKSSVGLGDWGAEDGALRVE